MLQCLCKILPAFLDKQGRWVARHPGLAGQWQDCWLSCNILMLGSISISIKGGTTETKTSQGLQMSFRPNLLSLEHNYLLNTIFQNKEFTETQMFACKPVCPRKSTEIRDCLTFFLLTLFSCAGVIVCKGCRVLRSPLPQNPARLPYN